MSAKTLLKSFIWVVLFISAVPAMADPGVYRSQEHDFRLVQVADGLHHPWAVAFLPDGGYLVTERRGRLYRVDTNGDRVRIGNLPRVAAQGQGGLLDVVLHPEYQENGWIYLSYARPTSGGATTALARARLEDDQLRSFEVLFSAEPALGGGRHFGSRIAFDHDGYVYLTIGERGQMELAQDPSNHWGSTVRLYSDGGVPDDNPFVDQEGYLPELFTYGNRNAQGMIVHPVTGEIWQNEHGPRGGDELNLIQAGANYGWPEISHGEHYSGGQVGQGTHAEGMEQPVVHWTPAIAPSGMAYYDSPAFPGWQGSLFIGSLVDQHLRRVQLDGNEVTDQEVLLHREIGRVRDVRTSPEGYIYLLTDAANGRLYRLEPVED
ncbi:PQQ-dependent sugar dehydrogenase [Spirochaeta africana]|uniref:Glucose/sorbosone dehydrogenase n=1 Tax=Spirochaeta africana (strain ATCC 700263 / DSM 8902 / Z-7692) TaxID=889378 RepID=H9ULR9_SPIAZ|nr:PQQ-dependent sugar dehydrogenase [Spirochaeta africana]AFG38462.1 glucose/sorbosone dehydrogenase [Spirochaeta africana DSM 8902]